MRKSSSMRAFCHIPREISTAPSIAVRLAERVPEGEPRRAKVAYAPCGYCFELIGLSFVVLR